MPGRKQNAHKGDHGRGLVIGGSTVMPGSISMTVNAALKAEAGLITAGTSEKVIQMIASKSVEATYLALPETNGYLTNETRIPVEGYDAIALGIGMGRNKETGAIVHAILDQSTCPVIIDADGLHLMKPVLSMLKSRSHPVIMTPHPGEMAMLLDISVSELLSKAFHYSLAGKKV
ncbi:hydroxyethylthiazole kinase-like uncharacterized protein yjeF [Virgibacillus natechei]|uniref:Hydroxyethylthiazole kinase-like uncharacterized protein yjeF n=1 Tax=Virgibacillus natechei TaxID=1216297 RepID=A0ABS4IKJ1_9BACI|nr:ADP/ATP-dependent (S)-NAD(P)H-hydrate dehydratase [Virgibacillus natechei]MBP1971457.1 hydroxyethylthiazole kinase-like uncharacterized protein yjeF [Virgibacillus natechei]UZD13825.1 NAD(P)H-hydrate dehydratase [Virgibacillus natechei]